QPLRRAMYGFKAAVVGAGTMGAEIAHVIASAGVPVLLKDLDQGLVDRGLERAREVTAARGRSLVERGRLSEEQAGERLESAMALITGTTEYGGFGDVDFAIEAVPERMALKQAVFGELDAVTPGHAILASNTSALSIGELGEVTSRPARVVGLHFFWPASVMRLVEVVEGSRTSAETATAAMSFAQQIRKQPVRCADLPGFVVNRILTSAISELWRVQEEEGLDVEEVDRAVRESRTAPMGPFFLADLLGLDTVVGVLEHLRASYGERFYVPPAMKALVEAGDLGQKTGRGFYEHSR
ncbi:MAG: 3-hydroxyacyl-CoA dehydrogenase family protein, partial [Actinomycetota bacterium]|nr:3-hydroxyacyl-CoA dehydrogenase family protein [Actinomycetota bacterium]